MTLNLVNLLHSIHEENIKMMELQTNVFKYALHSIQLQTIHIRFQFNP